MLVYSICRLLAGGMPDVTALRDFAPYGYSAVAILAFILPARNIGRARQPIYIALGIHIVWVAAIPRLPGFPWNLPVLGTDAQVFGTRPDFDAAVAGIAAAFALRDLLSRGTSLAPALRAGIGAFALLNLWALTTLQTRAGLLAALAAIVVTVLTYFAPRREAESTTGESSPNVRKRLAMGAAGMIVLLAVLSVSPSGQRLVEGFTGSGQAAGTISVRQDVWDKVATFTFRDYQKTAVGIGFGRDIIRESGSQAEPEGSTYSKRPLAA